MLSVADKKSGPSPKKPGAKKRKSQDVMLVHGVNETGDEYAVLRAREDRVEAGVVKTLKEGEPVEGEVLKLTPREEAPLLYDVDVEVPRGRLNAPGGSESRKGPAQVASSTYRSNWDSIWNKKRPSKKRLLN